MKRKIAEFQSWDGNLELELYKDTTGFITLWANGSHSYTEQTIDGPDLLRLRDFLNDNLPE